MPLAGLAFIVRSGDPEVAEATIRRFHASGARLVVIDDQVQRWQQLSAELGGRIAACQMDLSSGAAAGRALAQAEHRLGRVSGLINCAGKGSPEHALTNAQPLARKVDEDIVRLLNLVSAAAPAMSRNEAGGKRGVFVNVASPEIWQGGSLGVAFAAGFFSMSLSVGSRLAALGIRVVAIACDPSQSPLVFAWPSPGEASWCRPRVPLRVDRPEDYASLVYEVVAHEIIACSDVDRAALSQREIEVLRLIALGKTNKEIGLILGISARTVQVHTSNIYGKIDVGNRAGAVSWLRDHQSRPQVLAARPSEALLNDISTARTLSSDSSELIGATTF